MDGGNPELAVELRHNPLLFEIIRSFTTLASTLNLSHAVRELGSTRQTVRRHISQLEEIKGGALFTLDGRQYILTELGARILPEALDLQARADGWLQGNARKVNGLQFLSHQDTDGWFFHQQQHSLGRAFESTSPLLPALISAWAEAGGDLEHAALQPLRPYLMVFRRVDDSWLFTEVGEKSSYVTWFGWTAARSSIGREIGQMQGGANFGRLVNLAHEEVEATGGVRLDHIYTRLPKAPENVSVPLSYERLLLGSRFPDGSFAMITLVRRTYDVEIEGVDDEMLRLMPEDMIM